MKLEKLVKNNISSDDLPQLIQREFSEIDFDYAEDFVEWWKLDKSNKRNVGLYFFACSKILNL